jgi:dolichol-phosphate mannosyltransferase
LHISIVSPVYKAPEILPELVARLEESLTKITDSFEVILVDDGCPWDSWNVVERLAEKYSFIKGIRLSRNFGQHYAITAGLDYAKGEWIVVMDCDLQDEPEIIVNLYDLCMEKNLQQLVVSSKNRNQHWFKNLSSGFFRIIFNFLTDAQLESGIGNYGIYHKKVITSVGKMGDAIRVFPVLVKWVGFRRDILYLERNDRANGKSSYTFMKLVRLSMDMGLAFSDKILKIGLFFGLLTIGTAFFYTIYILFKYFSGGITVPGYTSLLIAILLLSGMIMTFLGILGLYISKMFQKIKQRPDYIISEVL